MVQCAAGLRCWIAPQGCCCRRISSLRACAAAPAAAKCAACPWQATACCRPAVPRSQLQTARIQAAEPTAAIHLLPPHLRMAHVLLAARCEVLGNKTPVLCSCWPECPAIPTWFATAAVADAACLHACRRCGSRCGCHSSPSLPAWHRPFAALQAAKLVPAPAAGCLLQLCCKLQLLPARRVLPSFIAVHACRALPASFF